MSDDRLDDLLHALKEENDRILPPPFIATRLKTEVTRVAMRKKRRRYLTLLTPTFAGLFLLVGLSQWHKGVGSRSSMARIESTASNDRKTDDSMGEVQQSPLSGTKFIAIPSSAALAAPIDTTVIRVVLRKDKLRQLGFSVVERNSSELTKAEFVLGEDGLARSIRFVGSVDGISLLKVAPVGSSS